MMNHDCSKRTSHENSQGACRVLAMLSRLMDYPSGASAGIDMTELERRVVLAIRDRLGFGCVGLWKIDHGLVLRGSFAAEATSGVLNRHNELLTVAPESPEGLVLSAASKVEVVKQNPDGDRCAWRVIVPICGPDKIPTGLVIAETLAPEEKPDECTIELLRFHGIAMGHATHSIRGNINLDAIAKRYKDLADSLPLAILEADESGRVTFWNLGALSFFGYSDNDFTTGLNINSLLGGNSKDDLRHARDEGTASECVAIRKDGTEFGVLKISQAVDAVSGSPGQRVIVVDLSDRKRTEEVLKETEESRRLMGDLIPDMIYMVDASGKILYVNKAAAAQFRAVPEAMIGRKLADVFPQELATRHLVNIRKVIASGEEFVGESRDLFGEREVLIDVHLVPVHDAHGKVTAACGISRDITERRLLEEKSTKNHKLESLALLAGGIAHDFNNTLTAILGNISVIKARSPHVTKDIGLVLDEMDKACVRAKDLTQQLLTFSRGGAPIKEATSIDEVVRESAIFALRGSKCRCVFRMPAGMWRAEVDAGQIHQVIHNMVINAEQAMPSGGEITITGENVVAEKKNPHLIAPGKYVKLSITDTGIGIAERHLQKIFDLYFTTKQSGNGLGLAICLSIVEKHGGHLEVESEVGKGTTFYIFLPAIEHIDGRESDKKPSRKMRLKGSGRLLVMDDDEALLSTVKRMLTSIGYEVHGASEGSEVIRMYQEARKAGKPYDVIILDLTIPAGMGAKETVSKLKDMDPAVKAIVSSGYANDNIMMYYKEFGFRGVIAKPYRLDELSMAVRQAMGE